MCRRAEDVAAKFEALHELLIDPARRAAFKARCFAEDRVRQPHLTDAHRELQWRYAMELFGYDP